MRQHRALVNTYHCTLCWLHAIWASLVMVLCSQNQTILISDQQFSVKLERKALWPGHSQSTNPAVVGLDTLKPLLRDRGSTQATHCTREWGDSCILDALFINGIYSPQIGNKNSKQKHVFFSCLTSNINCINWNCAGRSWGGLLQNH